MKTRTIRWACLAASLGIVGSLGVSAPTAWAAGNSGSATGIFIASTAHSQGPSRRTAQQYFTQTTTSACTLCRATRIVRTGAGQSRETPTT